MAPTTQAERTEADDGRKVIWDLINWFEGTGGGQSRFPERIYEAAKKAEPGCELCRGTPGRIRNDTTCPRGCQPDLSREESEELAKAVCGLEMHAEVTP
jgi:hypothetical protein